MNYFLGLFILVTTWVRGLRRACSTVVNLPVMAERPRSSFLGVAILASYFEDQAQGVPSLNVSYVPAFKRETNQVR